MFGKIYVPLNYAANSNCDLLHTVSAVHIQLHFPLHFSQLAIPTTYNKSRQ